MVRMFVFVLVIGIWNLEFICDLVLVIWNFSLPVCRPPSAELISSSP
jgi:hypothetical protein